MNAHNPFTQHCSAAQAGAVPASERAAESSVTSGYSEPAFTIHIGKTLVAGKAGQREVFTMTLGNETIQLLPLKTWSQLDLFKWRVRGVLPGTPVGLEITLDYIKIACETVSTRDPDACDKLEKAFNEWLLLELRSIEMTKLKAHASKVEETANPPEEDELHYQLQTDNTGTPRLKCLEGKHTVKIVALNLPGLSALVEERLLRKPGTLKVGALHDWVELDGELFRFQEGTDWAARLEQVLNERYLPTAEPGQKPDVAVFRNPASPTGFDIQFPASPNGIVENRKYHLNEESVELLADPQKCRVLRKGVIAKLTPPTLIFKQKTPDGGERCLDSGRENLVRVLDPEGQPKEIDLSRPVDLLHLDARELTAVFNHPAINRHARLAAAAAG